VSGEDREIIGRHDGDTLVEGTGLAEDDDVFTLLPDLVVPCLVSLELNADRICAPVMDLPLMVSLMLLPCFCMGLSSSKGTLALC
jgi:hypothetical protein